MYFLNHIPALQVLIPFMGAILCTVIRQRASYYIALLSGICCFIISVVIYNTPLSYAFGNWLPSIGIEYRLDSINQPVIIYVNSALVFLLLFNRSIIVSGVLSSIVPKRQNLFFTILLFAHAGFIGMLSTNDIFNLYVFIEISSLAAYILISLGNKPFAAIGAFDYLMLGTIGATFVLIGIGFLLAVTGSLNMSDIHLLLEGKYHLKTVVAAVGFITIGCTLKLAFFPLHFWMVRAYNNASSAVLVYLAAISGIIGTYLLYRIFHHVFEFNNISVVLGFFLYPLSILSMIICSLMAYSSKTLRELIIYSAASQIGYVLLIFSKNGRWDLMLNFLIFDGINKIALFIISDLEEKGPLFRSNMPFIALNLICSAGLPFGGMFFVKLKVLEFFIQEEFWFDFVILLTASAIAMLYHYRLVKKLFFEKAHTSDNPAAKNLVTITLVQLVLPWAIL
jgi:multicomponent Na+:H+ antiporter subunit D